MAKDMAENKGGARVLIVIVVLSIGGFNGPNEHNVASLVGQAIMGDGAAVMIVDADPDVLKEEKPLFQITSTSQNTIPYSNHGIEGHISETCFTIKLSKVFQNWSEITWRIACLKH